MTSFCKSLNVIIVNLIKFIYLALNPALFLLSRQSKAERTCCTIVTKAVYKQRSVKLHIGCAIIKKS